MSDGQVKELHTCPLTMAEIGADVEAGSPLLRSGSSEVALDLASSFASAVFLASAWRRRRWIASM